VSPVRAVGSIIRVVTVDGLNVGGDAEEVYLQYAHELVGFATGLVGPWDAADVVADAMSRCDGTPTWVKVLDHRAYLYRAVLNGSRQWVRSKSSRAVRERLFSAQRTIPREVELRPEVWEAVRRLSVRQRAVIVLAYWEDLTPAQIAVRLGLSEGAVRRHLARAREHLRKVLTDD
jgi:RNA polymerase sigma factor (sigma-70 family)